MRRKKHAGAHENHERWLLTYADMITLLVAFFIMLYAMSVVSKAKFDQLAISVRSGFDGDTKMQAVKMPPGAGILDSNAMISPAQMPTFQRPPSISYQLTSKQQMDEDNLDRVKAEIEKVARDRGIASLMQVMENARGLDIRILADRLLFDKGDGHLRPDSGWLLKQIAAVLNSVPNDITIEGHTDDLPISTPEYPSNWELSTSRATNVLRFLVEHGHIVPTRICAAGYADTRPIFPNTSEENRAHNRRVDIVILRASADNQLN